MIENIVYKKLTTNRTEDGYINNNCAREKNLPTSNTVDTEMLFSDLCRHIQTMENTRQNYAFRHIYSCRKIIGKAIVFCKRVVRKLLKWYIEPICVQQTEFNNSVTPAIGRLTELTRELFYRNEQQQRNNAEMNQRIDELEKQQHDEQAALANSMTEVVRKIDQMEKERLLQKETSARKEQSIDEQLHVMQAEFKEIRSMLTLNADSIQSLETSLDCVREADPSIFSAAKQNFFDKNTTSQSGEDSIAAYIAMALGYQPEEISYLDVGANHAKELSNTYYFYRSGAHGVLVEANPDLIPELKLKRSRDVILNKCVTDTSGETVDFFVISGDGLSSSCKESVDDALCKNEALTLKKTVSVETVTANSIMEQYFGGAPLLLNIDIEGSDMNVLRSIDFDRFRPLIIIAETIPYSPKLVVGQKNIEEIAFLESKDYLEYAFTGINSIFLDKRQLKGRATL